MAKKDKIAFYGYDKLTSGIEPPDSINEDNFELDYIEYHSQEDLDRYCGVIIPQGIFENIDLEKKQHEYDALLLADREREVRNLLANKGWICFLVRWIIDSYDKSSYTRTWEVDTSKTDLCKRILGGIPRKPINLTPKLVCHSDQFKEYVKKYGVAGTIFPNHITSGSNINKLISINNGIAGFENNNQIFILPFHTMKYDTESLIQLSHITVRSVLDYRTRHLIIRPDWFRQIVFIKEKRIVKHLDRINSLIADKHGILQTFEEYKEILITTDDILRNRIIKVLSKFFSLNVNPEDRSIEDFKIFDDDAEIICVGETKGTNKGVKRIHINQVDIHRERNQLGNSVSGLLIINNQLGKTLEEKCDNAPADELINHAVYMNVTIMRSVDLIYLMLHFEKKPEETRKSQFIDLIKQGGGWLSATPDSFKLVK